MKKFVVCFMLGLVSPNVYAGDLWISNKVEVGYDKAFIASKASFNKEGLTKIYVGPGYEFDLCEGLKFEPAYAIQFSKSDAWRPDHKFKFSLEWSL